MAATIAVSCPQCQKQFKAPEELQGKRIRCKGCGHVFAIPAAKVAASDEDQGSDPYGLAEVKESIPRCPNCAHLMESLEAVICLNCGFNLRTGTRIKTKRTVEITPRDRFLWLLPGILAVAAAVLLIVFDIVYYLWKPDGRGDWDWLSHGSFKLWTIIGSGFIIFFALAFAYKRLILEPNPPEQEV
ncbi:MAG: hypothetical protein NZ700_09180 [Gemmataceae bacterium]|nr:hypothetical protein [Gemmataceae bacterium]MDW8264182.1 hypothetical protein [Gemmataceae bacterium]